MAMDDRSNTLLNILSQQQQAWQAEPCREYRLRRQDLFKLETILTDNAGALSEAMSADFGYRSPHESLLADIIVVKNHIRHTRKHVRSWMKPRLHPVGWQFWPASAWTERQPLGVVGIMAPWNYPVNLVIGPLAAALAAGNRAMLKPSEMTPATGRLLQEIIAAAFAEDHVTVILGEIEVSKAFASLPFDHLLFTGSTAVGRAVMRAAAENLTPVTLELGGKSPAIIAADTPAVAAARRLGKGKWFNAGQTCIAPDYVLIEGRRAGELASAMAAQLQSSYPEGSTDYSHIINQSQYNRLDGVLRDAVEKGATVLQPLGNPDPHTRRFTPTLLTGVDKSMLVMQEEIFGPILPILDFADIDSAIEVINAGPRPLALYYFGRSGAEMRRVLEQTVSGGVCLNDCVTQFAAPGLPFGGVGESGMGHYHSKQGFDTFTKLKPVLRQSRWAGLDLIRPPYGKLADRILKFLLGRQ
jgi:coniferyl-aldehyde dehydrogenase